MESKEPQQRLYALLIQYCNPSQQIEPLKDELLRRENEIKRLDLSEEVEQSLIEIHRSLLFGRKIQYFRLKSALSERQYADYKTIADLIDLEHAPGYLGRHIKSGISINLFGNNYISPLMSSLMMSGFLGSIGGFIGFQAGTPQAVYICGIMGALLGGSSFFWNKNYLREAAEVIYQRTDYIRENYPKLI
jgi:hypothetical protein